MIKIKTQKALAFVGIVATLVFSSQANATVIGTGSVTGSPALDSPVNWNDTYTTGSATGVITGITINARVLPTLNMVISSGSIELGTLNNSTYITGSVDIEVGTNAKNGASISARSSSGGLYSSATTTTINNLSTDGVAESYLFSSVSSGGTDSSIPGFSQTFLSATEVNNNTTNHTIYTSNKAQSSSGTTDVSFRVSSKIDAQTPAASDYRDVVVVTIVGNF